MKYLHEYRQAESVQKIAAEIAGITTRSWTIMEVCGGQTNAIVKYGLQQFLPKHIELIHGPGCPVCVTPVDLIDSAIDIASRPEVIFCSFGDMLRVPGREKDLQTVKAQGGDVRIVYSPLDALKLAEKNPDKEIVFLAIGFETTAPANAMAVHQAQHKDISNFSLLCSQFTVPPVIEHLCASPQSRIQGFLAAGHVCAVTGYAQYPALAKQYQVPMVVTGFEPLDILEGIFLCVQQLEQGRIDVENQYARAVLPEGNLTAQQMMAKIFTSNTQTWRGLGTITNSGLSLKKSLRAWDAEYKFGLKTASRTAPLSPSASQELIDEAGCLSGAILQGIKKPHDCAHFGTRCRPESPIGAPMVSTEGACAAYYHYAGHRLGDSASTASHSKSPHPQIISTQT